MKHIRLRCEGITLGSIQLPRFQLGSGDLVCLHMPCVSGSKTEAAVVAALTGRRAVPGLDLSDRVALASPAVDQVGFFALLDRPTVARWLRRSGLAAQAEDISARLGLDPQQRLGRIPWTARVLLGLEAAWASGAAVIVFTTAGLDMCGRRVVFDAIASRLQDCPAIHLSYAYETQGRRERACPPNARCLELHRALGDLAPV